MPLVPISREAHAATRVSPLRSFAFAATTTIVPLFGGEILQFAQELPVVFVPDSEGFSVAGLLGIRSGENLLVSEQGQWMAATIPNLWKRGPFRLAYVEGEAEEKMVLCLDDSSDLLNRAEGQPLFDENGEPAPLVGGASNLLSQLERDMRITRKICSDLKRLGLIVPWGFEFPQPDGSTSRASDIYQVDETKIGTLAAEDLVALRDSGALPLIYAHLLSLGRISLLLKLAKMAADRRQQREAVNRSNLNLDKAFGIVEDDPFIF